jgi:ribonuclease T1
MGRWLLIFLAWCSMAAGTVGVASQNSDKSKDAEKDKDEIKLPKGVPAKVGKVLKYVDEHDKAPEGYEGGRHFGNFEKRLPEKDGKGKAIKYREWDVNPLKKGVNRGPERLVTGSDGSAHYTDDHYKTFKKIR